MGYNDRLKYNVQATALTITGATAGTLVAGPALLMSRVKRGLSAQCNVTAETNGITLTAVWQVSNDNVSWANVTPSNGAANVPLATGTSGTDDPVSRAVSAPDAVYGARYARVAILVGAQTGGASDVATVGYSYSAD